LVCQRKGLIVTTGVETWNPGARIQNAESAGEVGDLTQRTKFSRINNILT